MSLLGIGIIGCGKAGRYHANWYSKNPNCIIKGFYNRTPGKAEELSKKYNAEAYYNTIGEELCKKFKKIDFIFIGVSSGEICFL